MDSNFPLVVVLLGMLLLFVGVRAIQTQRILKGRSLTEHITGPKAVTWGWIYTVVGAGLFLWGAWAVLF